VRAADWAPTFDEPTVLAGEVSAELAEHLLSLPDAENAIISSLAGSVRRAGYLAELAWERLEAGESDDLDSLAPIYLHQPTSGTTG
jgi:tRNA threonylcarbamoyladenosine biosynthesis protein TsaB